MQDKTDHAARVPGFGETPPDGAGDTAAMDDPSLRVPSALGAAPAARVAAESVANALMVSERQYRRLFEAARDGILLLDSEYGRITDANPFMTELLGYSHDQLLGKELWEIGLLRDKQTSQRAFLKLKREHYIRYEDLPLEDRQGERREVEFVSNLYREDGHTVIQCNIRDITERKRVAGELVAAAARHAHQDAVLEERTRMAREIHDTLAQGFTGIMAQLEAAEAALANAPDPAAPPGGLAVCRSELAALRVQMAKVQTRIGKARDLARESLAEARRSVAALRPPPLEAASLSEALARFLVQRVMGTATRGRYALEGVPQALPDAAAHCLLRVGHEAIANAVTHARAEEVTVTLSFQPGPMHKPGQMNEPERVRLCVRDDGRGFDPLSPGAGRFGIVGMRERAEQAGGELTIVSHAGGGTAVTLTVPVPQGTLGQETPKD